MKKELVLRLTKKDFRVEAFPAGGPGGQNQNKVASAVRITHRATGISAECRETRDQLENKKRALKRLSENKKFRTWLKIRAWEITQGKTVEERVDELMDPGNITTEVQENGRWVEATELYDA